MNKHWIEDGVMVVKLTQGQYTIVEIEDWPKIEKYHWFAHKTRKGWRVIARPDSTSTVYLHRLLCPTELQVDHKDGNGLNNLRLSNLRPATHAQNQRNRGKNRNNKSGFKGVRLEQGRWRAQVSVNGKTTHIGCYSSAIEAAKAHDTAVINLHGEFAHLNFPV